jgi:hypothetical protein
MIVRMCPHTSTYVSAYYYVCVRILLQTPQELERETLARELNELESAWTKVQVLFLFVLFFIFYFIFLLGRELNVLKSEWTRFQV